MLEQENKVVAIHSGDLRIATLYGAVLDLCYARAEGMPIATIVGILEMAKYELQARH